MKNDRMNSDNETDHQNGQKSHLYFCLISFSKTRLTDSQVQMLLSKALSDQNAHLIKKKKYSESMCNAVGIS